MEIIKCKKHKYYERQHQTNYMKEKIKNRYIYRNNLNLTAGSILYSQIILKHIYIYIGHYIFACYSLINHTLRLTQRERNLLSVFDNRMLTEIMWYKIELY